MDARVTTRPVAQVLSAIQALDLESVKARMMDEELGEGWSREYADGIETAYKTYLSMLVKYPEHAEDIMLNKDVDEFWHTHILQTRKYAEDCERVFGNFLHHNPHVGERTADYLETRARQVELTSKLYAQEQLAKAAGQLSGQPGTDSRIAAYCNVQKNAYCNASVTTAAYCNVTVGEASQPSRETAYCNASTKALATVAYCNAVSKASDPAYCNVSVNRDGSPAYCNVSIKKEGSAAYCNVSVNRDGSAAYCNASIKKAGSPAYCNASVHSQRGAYCNASIVPDAGPAYCNVSLSLEGEAAYCNASLKAHSPAV